MPNIISTDIIINTETYIKYNTSITMKLI